MSSYSKADKKAMKREMQKAKDKVMYRKYQTILLHMAGKPNTEIAVIVGIDRKTAGIYINLYKVGGIENLVPKKPPGRPRLLNKHQELELYTVICGNTPDEVGFDGVMNWTAKIASEWAYRNFGIRYTIDGMLAVFNRLNLSYTRPTYVLAKADAEKQAQFIDTFEGIKKTHKWCHRPHPI